MRGLRVRSRPGSGSCNKVDSTMASMRKPRGQAPTDHFAGRILALSGDVGVLSRIMRRDQSEEVQLAWATYDDVEMRTDKFSDDGELVWTVTLTPWRGTRKGKNRTKMKLKIKHSFGS